ncbi:MAG: nucleotidyltransferase family protein [Chloroflexi bacterium]|nr:nucleotidyltransferase family protein [Chloroflexota bacterium]
MVSRLGIRPSWWPTEQQEWLLRAAFLHGRAAVDAWHSWRSTADFDLPEPGTYRLLPQLYRNLDAERVDDPVMDRLKGVYRRTWYENQILFKDLVALLRSFQSAGLDAMPIKAIYLVWLHCRDHGLRPIDGFDILVRAEMAHTAVELLKRLGWRPRPDAPEKVMSVAPFVRFKDGAGRRLDLHRHVIGDLSRWDAGNGSWERSSVITILGTPARVPNPTDQFFDICIAGLEWSCAPHLVRLADAMTVLAWSSSDIDWNWLVREARRCQTTLALRDMLDCLQSMLDARIPPDVVDALHSSRVSRAEHLEFRAGSLRHKAQWRSLSLLFSYRRQTSANSVRQRITDFPRYLQHALGVRREPFKVIRCQSSVPSPSGSESGMPSPSVSDPLIPSPSGRGLG